ncbi:MAG: hypothetical protein GC171_09805 [Terrimonas sp.]|nr:hypothetical protein [Terrimonas sp.]
MKKILFIFGVLLFSFSFVHAQDESNDEANGKVKERFREFMQQRLNLSKEEANRAFPLFLRYFNEIRTTNQQFRDDKLVRQQKIIEIKLRFRDQIRQTIKDRPERMDPEKVDRAVIEFRQALKDEAGKRNLQLRRRGGLDNPKRNN